MIRNYLKIALRTFTRNLSYALINILGLAIGMACCIVIALYVRFELSFESFQEKREEIYRYISKSTEQGELAMNGSPNPLRKRSIIRLIIIKDMVTSGGPGIGM